jgi:hypothetical protein
MQIDRVRRHSATASMVFLEGGVVGLRMSGPLTIDALAYFADELVAQHGRQAPGYVFDYRSAVMLATPNALDALVAEVPQHSALRKPGAFVGLRGATEPLRQQAIRMAGAGCPRRVFLDHEVALAWVLRAASRH